MVTDLPIQAILDRLVEHIVAVMPVTAAGVTLIAADGEPPHYISASNVAALRFERVRTKLADGPCLAAFNKAIAAPDLRLDERFQALAAEAIRSDLLAVFAFPLRHGDYDAIGALDLLPRDARPVGRAAGDLRDRSLDVPAGV